MLTAGAFALLTLGTLALLAAGNARFGSLLGMFGLLTAGGACFSARAKQSAVSAQK
ncbi:hypothetical protein TERTU_0554 [Teredinibacter turnerae T7901]|uniref:Uncharacterized protein n=1 Tax=Teredinibacter turnerae (strain ATCC 39867 / T7901) TaxID=377629 RepID=C5BN50_TERTT|nr:hypothetical protein TERTU_0554 [Teredinibacter turnerae T7901]